MTRKIAQRWASMGLFVCALTCLPCERAMATTAGPPPEVTVEQIFGDIEVLANLRSLSLTANQLAGMVGIVEGFSEVRQRVARQRNRQDVRRALWQVREFFLLAEEAEEPWTPMEAYHEFLEEQEEVLENAVDRAVGQMAALLTKEQTLTIARRETLYGEIEQAVKHLAALADSDDDEWREWRNDVATELTEMARDENPDAPRGLNDRIVMFMIQARAKGADYLKENQAKLYKELEALILPAERRGGPSAEEREERVHEVLEYMLREERVLPLLKEKLAKRSQRNSACPAGQGGGNE